MNFNISKTAFFNALQTVNSAVSSNSPSPARRGILVDVKSDRMVLTGSDADITIQTTLYTKDEQNQFTIDEPGKILVEAKYLLEIVRKLDQENIHVEIIDGFLSKFEGKQAIFKINGMNPKDYPNFEFDVPSHQFKMLSTDLFTCISQTKFAASTKDTRPIFQGINFQCQNQTLILTATDTYRLARKTIPLDAEPFNVTIPVKSLNNLHMTLPQDEVIDILYDDKKVQFRSENTLIQVRLLDGVFPKTEHLIPSEFSSELKMARMDLIHAIDRCLFLRNENMPVVRLNASTTNCELYNRSLEVGESNESLNAVFEGEAIEVSFSGNYVLDAARSFLQDDITIHFTGVMKPFILTDPNDPSLLQLVLPIRTYN